MSNNDDFFAKQNEEGGEGEAAPSTIKIGEKEYSQDELNKLVGLGNIAQELESKWNTKIDKIYPKFTEATQKLSEYEKREQEEARVREEERKKEIEAGKVELTPEERRQYAIKEAEELGLLHQGNVRNEVVKVIQAIELNKELDRVVDEMASKGLPRTSGDELLEHMEETGIKNPEKAYKDMFEKQYDEWKEKQLKSVASDGLVTESTSTAGGKEPASVKVTRDNIEELLGGVLTRNG